MPSIIPEASRRARAGRASRAGRGGRRAVPKTGPAAVPGRGPWPRRPGRRRARTGCIPARGTPPARTPRPGQRDIGGHARPVRPPQPRDDRPDARPLVGPRLVLRGAEPGRDPVRPGAVVGRVVVQAPDDRQLVHDPRLPGQQLADRRARHGRRDRAELAPELAGRVGLQVIRVDVRRPAAEQHLDDRRVPRPLGPRPQPQQVGQRQPPQPQRPDAQEAPPAEALTRPIATSEHVDHGRALMNGKRDFTTETTEHTEKKRRGGEKK